MYHVRILDAAIRDLTRLDKPVSRHVVKRINWLAGNLEVISQEEKFQALLGELFEFDCTDLDFGVYRIINHKRQVIERFITKDLPKAIAEELAQGALAEKYRETQGWTKEDYKHDRGFVVARKLTEGADEVFFNGECMEFTRDSRREDLDKDRKLTLALVKEIEIIGEAAYQVSEETRRCLPGIPWEDIVGMRHAWCMPILTSTWTFFGEPYRTTFPS